MAWHGAIAITKAKAKTITTKTIIKQDQIELGRSASFQCSMFNVQCSMLMFNVLCTVGEVA